MRSAGEAGPPGRSGPGRTNPHAGTEKFAVSAAAVLEPGARAPQPAVPLPEDEDLLGTRKAGAGPAVAPICLDRSGARHPVGPADPPLGRPHEAQPALLKRLRVAEAALDRVPLAVFGLRADATVLFANRAARALAADGDGLCLIGGRLVAKVDAAALRGLLARAAAGFLVKPGDAPGGSIAIRRAPGRLPLGASALPAGAGDAGDVLLFVTDPAAHDVASHQTLRTVFDLTDREASVAAAIVRLGTVPAVAAQLKIAPSTARSHLQRVFDKTGARSQVALAQMLAALACARSEAVSPVPTRAHGPAAPCGDRTGATAW